MGCMIIATENEPTSKLQAKIIPVEDAGKDVLYGMSNKY